METFTTTTEAGRTIELEIVQNAPYGYAVNSHQLNECVGKLYRTAGGFRVTAGELEINLQDGEKELGTFAEQWEAFAAVVSNVAEYLEANEEAGSSHDPADADELLMDLLDPEVYGDHYGPAARRDILRRAAYDMGINDRRAHAEMLPVIARRAADMIRVEFAPQLREMFLQDLADVLEAQGWNASPTRTSYEHRTENASFDLNISDESVRVYAARPHSTVEMLALDAKRTSADRAARIILALFA
ncbi:hypothetical protein PBI_KEPLER_29 [Arthrobacter phage Kepler]|uniref:Uncharacterized protein n=1 Tax=Arthrobacter phage Kepler TaxID=2419959 RepID=A0A3G2KGZ5_9CAUD|nr:hypothetical protein HOU55_gp29 [Arthrobacter phage Kepler]AYN58256.1 hypothetical protein PBI_KEPLER_29 [Arthrobacter phage Kepler]